VVVAALAVTVHKLALSVRQVLIWMKGTHALHVQLIVKFALTLKPVLSVTLGIT